MKKRFFLPILFIVIPALSGIALATDRADEIMEEMWNSLDKDFKVVVIPEKWKNKSAVIIAQFHRFEYRKAVMANLLRVNEYSHYRIKLIDQNAINRYAEISYLDDRAATSTVLKVYVGFKVIKPTGKEIIVNLANVVKMEREGSAGKIAYNKIAIPNLEPGDILDYYICEEEVVQRTALIQFFEPIIYNLPQEYPVIKQKLQFQVQRKCYINLRSLNGAPELKLVNDEKNDEKYYSLEDGDRDGVKDIRWLYPNRELPTIKFRAAYASSSGARSFDVLLGDQGEVKNKVTGQEIVDLTKSLMSTPYYTKDASRYIKEKHKGVKDPFEISKAAYYYYRNQILQGAEISTLEQGGSSGYNQLRFTHMFSSFLSSKKIPHDIIVGVDRNISSLDDIVIENELEYFIRVKKGQQNLYFFPPNIFLKPGSISSRLEGTYAYAMDGLYSPTNRIAKRITLPASLHAENITETVLNVTTTDMISASISATHTLKGYNKLSAQYEFLDVYDAINEDNTKFKKLESFTGYASAAKKKYSAMKQAYLATREKNRNENLKKLIETDYEFKIKDVSNFEVTQTGRFDDKPEMIYSFDFVAEDLFKKTGSNYLIDIAKLIEQQVKIEGDELERNYAIYFDNTRSFKYKIIFEIPKGYEIQGLDKLNMKVENYAGGFVSTAKQENGKLIVETHKHYDNTLVSKEQWPSVVAFLNAANTFYEQRLLLKKLK